MTFPGCGGAMGNVSAGVPTQNRAAGQRHPSHSLPQPPPHCVQAGWAGKGACPSTAPAGGPVAADSQASPVTGPGAGWRGGDAIPVLGSRVCGLRPVTVVAILGQGKERAGINGAWPGPAGTGPATPVGVGAREPSAPGWGERPKTRAKRDRAPEAPGSPLAGGEAPVGARRPR